MTATIPAYRMNPAEDVILFGDELAEGVLVLPEDTVRRSPSGSGEDQELRNQRFRRPDAYGCRNFVGEWVDGYQEADVAGPGGAWIVKKNSIPSGGTS